MNDKKSDGYMPQLEHNDKYDRPVKVDRRVRRTRKALRTELLKLLMKKKLNEITVKELCVKADINTGTFYLHYMDVFDLFEKIQNEMQEEIMAFIEKIAGEGAIGDPKNMLPIFLELFDYLAMNQDFCTVLLTQNANQEFIQSLLSIGLDDCVESWMRMFEIKQRRVPEMFYQFIVSGCVGILRYWLLNEQKETPGDLADLTKQFITKGMGMLENLNKQ